MFVGTCETEGERGLARLAILDPRNLWSAGVASVAEGCGVEVVGRWQELPPALAKLLEDPPELLLIARSLLVPGLLSEVQRLGESSSIILVIEPGDRPSLSELDGVPFSGILLRSASTRATADCIGTVAAGHAWIDPLLLQPPEPERRQPDWSCLSDRELQVAHLAAKGWSNKLIARKLDVSDGTVKMHMHHILGKLNLESRSDLSLWDWERPS